MNIGQVTNEVFVFMVLIGTAAVVEGTWETLLVFNVKRATSVSLTEAWNGQPSTSPTNQTLLDLLGTVEGDKPYVSSLVNTWTTNPPEKVQMKAMEYVNGTDVLLLEAEFHINSNQSEFDSWMNTEALTNDLSEEGSIERNSNGTIFNYTYAINTTADHFGGMAFFWNQDFYPAALLLTSTEKSIGYIDYIRSNMEVHLARLSYSLVKGKEEIISHTVGISLITNTVNDGILTILVFGIDKWLWVYSVVLRLFHKEIFGGYILVLQNKEGGRLVIESNEAYLTIPVHDEVEHIEFRNSGRSIIENVVIEIYYLYMPYESAGFLVIQGYYPEGGAVADSESNIWNSSLSPVSSSRSTSPNSSITESAVTIPYKAPEEISSNQLTTSPVSAALDTDSADPLTTSPMTVKHSWNFSPHSDSGETRFSESTTTNSEAEIDSNSEDRNNHHNSSDVHQAIPTESCARNCSCRKAIWNSTNMESLIAAGNKTAIDKALKLLQELKTELSVNKSVLTSYRLKKISANDTRPSAAGIGSLGIVIIVGVVLAVVFLDIVSLLRKK